MAVKKIQLSDVLKKDIKIVSYLLSSIAIASVISLIVDKPELIVLTPVVNYVLFRIEQELKKEGYVKVLRG